MIGLPVKADIYPASASERTRWILARRGPKTPGLSPFIPYAFLHEHEIGPTGEPVSTATLFLTNRECPFRCLMCDLWQNTLDTSVPPGAIVQQIEYALERLEPAQQIKLYNAGSFFDNGAIPSEDDQTIAALCARFERVIIECHPTLATGTRCLRFRDLLQRESGGRTQLEVAMGLETVHPTVLERLNKRMTADSFVQAARFLQDNHIDLRVFLLVRPPFLTEAEGRVWAMRSLEVAFGDANALVACVIPTRAGNGAMEELQRAEHFMSPSLVSLEAVTEYGLELCTKLNHTDGRGRRIFADLWDVEKFATCPVCSPVRSARLARRNETQQPEPILYCPNCGEGGNT